jgi:ribosomal protein S18 acetylase RimI-like enzyme
MTIVPLGRDHVDDVARLHCSSLSGLLSRLGMPAIRAFYAGCVVTGAAIAFVAIEENAVRGYVLGAVQPGRLKAEVLRRSLTRTLSAMCLGVMRRPSTLWWLLRSRWGPDQGSYDREAAELTYLAVAAEHRGRGIGRRLVDSFTGAMRAAGVPAYQLSVDGDNRAAAAFYQRMGFRQIGRYRELGVLHCRYELEVSAPPCP